MFIKRAPAPWTMLVLKHARSEWCLNLRPLTIKSIFFYGSCLLMHRYPRWEMIGDAWRREHFLNQLKCEEVLGKMQMGWNRAARGMQQNRPRGKNKGSGGRQNWGHIDGEEATNIHAAFKVIRTPEFLLVFFLCVKHLTPQHPKLLLLFSVVANEAKKSISPFNAAPSSLLHLKLCREDLHACAEAAANFSFRNYIPVNAKLMWRLENTQTGFLHFAAQR